MARHILVLGATGPTGVLFCSAALQACHTLTLYVRNPSKLPDSVSEHANVNVIRGDFADADGLEKAAKCGADIFITFAGPVFGQRGTPIADALQVLFPKLIEHGVSRALVLATPSYTVSEDEPTWKWPALIWLIKTLVNSAYQDINATCTSTVSQPLDQLKWTIFRVPNLTNGEAVAVNAGFTGDGKDVLWLSRKSLVAWVLTEMGEGNWVGKAPSLSN